MSQWIVDASLTLGWYLKDEEDRAYNLDVLAGLDTNEAVVPFLWTYEVANGLVSQLLGADPQVRSMKFQRA